MDKLNNLELSETLGRRLGLVWQLLRDVDLDLAEFAARLFEQALSIFDLAGDVSNVIMSASLRSVSGQSNSYIPQDDAVDVQGQSPRKGMKLSELMQKLDLLHEHVLCLIDCTEVVDVHHSMLYAGKRQGKCEIKAGASALKQLHQIDLALGRFRKTLLIVQGRQAYRTFVVRIGSLQLQDAHLVSVEVHLFQGNLTSCLDLLGAACTQLHLRRA